MSWHLRGLWGKERLQQRWVLRATAALVAFIGLIAMHAFRSDPSATQPMVIVAETLMLFVPVIGFTQAQASVVREYAAKTQLFVEALPLRRWEMPLAKFAWGLSTQLALTLSLWAAVAFYADVRDVQFLAITGVRTLVYVLCCWSLLFGLATLGRLRWLAYSTLLVLVLVLQNRGVEIRRFGPIGLIDPLSFPYERRLFPVRALVESVALAGMGLSLGLGLPVLHEGSMAEVLARRASTAEKAGFWIVLFCQLLVPSWLNREQRRAPFSFTNAAVLTGTRWNTQVMYGEEAWQPQARSTLDALDRLAAGLSTDLGVAEPPALRVAQNSAVQTTRLAGQALGAGVLLETNFASTYFSVDALAATATFQSLVELSAARALFEPNRWFGIGFASYWAPRSGSGSESDDRWLAALVARRTLPLDAERLSRWEQLNERVGDSLADSIAFVLVEALERRHGREAVLSMARALLARPTVRNGADLLLGRRADLPLLLEHSTGESWPSFVEYFQTQLDLAAARLAEPLGKVPALRAELRISPTDLGNDIVYQLSGAPPATERSCLLRHTGQLPYDTAASELNSQNIAWAANTERLEGRLQGQYQSGQRVLALIDCWSPELNRWVRLEARRLEVP